MTDFTRSWFAVRIPCIDGSVRFTTLAYCDLIGQLDDPINDIGNDPDWFGPFASPSEARTFAAGLA